MPDPRAAYRSDPKKISKSKTQDFDECRLKYKLEHVDGVQTHDPEAVITGTIGHEALLLLSTFCEQPTEGLIRKACLYVQAQGFGHAVAREKAEAILLENADMIDFTNAIATERGLEIDMGNGFTLNGTLDRIDLETKPERRLRVVDYKFGRWVPPGSLTADSQAQFYLVLAKAHVASLLGLSPAEGDLVPISFERCWVALGFVEGPVFWSEDLDARGRARALTHAREANAETEWRPTVGPHCKRCSFVGSCSQVTVELERRRHDLETILPIEALTLSPEELYDRAKIAKDTAGIATARYEALEAQIRSTLDLEGPVQVGRKFLDFQTKRGWRPWDEANPQEVARVLRAEFGSSPDAQEIAVAPTTDGDAVKAWIKKLPKDQRERAEEVLDLVVPRKTRQNVRESEAVGS